MYEWMVVLERVRMDVVWMEAKANGNATTCGVCFRFAVSTLEKLGSDECRRKRTTGNRSREQRELKNEENEENEENEKIIKRTNWTNRNRTMESSS